MALTALRPVHEVDRIRDDLDGASAPAVVSLVGAGLDPARDVHEPALAEVLGAELGHLTPGHDGDEVGWPVAFVVPVVAVDGQHEPAHGSAGRRVPKFRVLCEPAAEADDVKQGAHLLRRRKVGSWRPGRLRGLYAGLACPARGRPYRWPVHGEREDPGRRSPGSLLPDRSPPPGRWSTSGHAPPGRRPRRSPGRSASRDGGPRRRTPGTEVRLGRAGATDRSSVHLGPPAVARRSPPSAPAPGAGRPPRLPPRPPGAGAPGEAPARRAPASPSGSSYVEDLLGFGIAGQLVVNLRRFRIGELPEVGREAVEVVLLFDHVREALQ